MLIINQHVPAIPTYEELTAFLYKDWVLLNIPKKYKKLQFTPSVRSIL